MHSRCCFTPIVAKSVGVVTSGHVTKMAVTPFDPPFLKTLDHVMRKFTALSFIDPELLPIEVLHCWNRNFAFFLRKMVHVIEIFSSNPKNDVAVTETHFLTHYRLFYLIC